MAPVLAERKAWSSDLYELSDDGQLRLDFHSGQLRAWDSERRFVVVLAGSQSG
jgi:hypothetical protein